MKPCVLITILDHGDTLSGVVQGLETYGVSCLIVDDGSNTATRETIQKLAQQHAWIRVERFAENRGRGAALRHGFRSARAQGFSHAFQIDADGQHDPAELGSLLAAAQAHPEALVLGAPVFDASAPGLRLFGRQFSRGLVWLETLSRAIEDPLCGYRGMPLDATVALLETHPMGDHMQFEVEVAVRLHWAGVRVVNVPVQVRYFSGGLSHFRPWLDTARIALTHMRLVAGMLARIPSLLRARARP